MFRVHQVLQGEYDPKSYSMSHEALAPTLYGPRQMLAHRFKELLVLAHQAGKAVSAQNQPSLQFRQLCFVIELLGQR
jgi:hypothetical protein